MESPLPLLPLALTCSPVPMQSDDDVTAASMWQQVWEESTTSSGSGLRLHVRAIVEIATADLRSTQWGRKKAAAVAIQNLSKSAGDELAANAVALIEVLLKVRNWGMWGMEVYGVQGAR
jgi:hypothetical protein